MTFPLLCWSEAHRLLFPYAKVPPVYDFRQGKIGKESGDGSDWEGKS
jgi:hypothetical protein